jgi:DNA integrity scanning protein DisA with diadenylate cyclase activity
VNLKEVLRCAQKNFNPSVIVLISNDKNIATHLGNNRAKTVLITSNPELKKSETEGLKIILKSKKELREREFPELGREVTKLFFQGIVGENDRVLAIMDVSHAFSLIFLNMQKQKFLLDLKECCGREIETRVIEEAIRIAQDISHEGITGALIIIGDTDNVLKHSTQLIHNPFSEQNEKVCILSENDRGSLKEFAKIDGALILDGNGFAVTAGRYIHSRRSHEVPKGLGGRHFAASTITRQTSALAVVCSSTGKIQIFRGGKPLLSF